MPHNSYSKMICRLLRLLITHNSVNRSSPCKSVHASRLFCLYLSLHLHLVAFFMKLLVPFFYPKAREAFLHIRSDDVKALATAWPCILDVTFLVVFPSIIQSPPPRQSFVRVGYQGKTAVLTFGPLALQIAFRVVSLGNNSEQKRSAKLFQVEGKRSMLVPYAPGGGGGGGGGYSHIFPI